MSNYKVEADRVSTNSNKKEYNRQLRIARRATAAALALREQIVDQNPKLAGPSSKRLASAQEALSASRVFAV